MSSFSPPVQEEVAWLNKTVEVVNNHDLVVTCGDANLWESYQQIIGGEPRRVHPPDNAFGRNFAVSAAVLRGSSNKFKDLLDNLGPSDRNLLLPDEDHKAMAILLHALHRPDAIVRDPTEHWECAPDLLFDVALLSEKYQCAISMDAALTQWSQTLPDQVRRNISLGYHSDAASVLAVLLAAALKFKHNTFGRGVVRIMLQRCTNYELKRLTDDDRISFSARAQILLQRAMDERTIGSLLDGVVAHFIYGDGPFDEPQLDAGCQCGTVKKGIASTYLGYFKGPGVPWRWPMSLETDRPLEILYKLQYWKIEVEASSTQRPCPHPDPDSNEMDSSCLCCTSDIFVRLQDEIRKKAREVSDRIGDFDYDFMHE